MAGGNKGSQGMFTTGFRKLFSAAPADWCDDPPICAWPPSVPPKPVRIKVEARRLRQQDGTKTIFHIQRIRRDDGDLFRLSCLVLLTLPLCGALTGLPVEC